MSFWDTMMGNTDPNQVSDQMTSGPMLGKIQGMADNLTDFGSEYYQQGKEFFANMFGKQGMDQAWSANRQQSENLAATGQSSGSGAAIGTMMQTFKDFGANAFNQTKKSLMDMWQSGQQIAQGYNQQATQIYADAGAAAASQNSQNNANTGGFIQNIAGMAVGAFLCDERAKKNIKKIGDDKYLGYQVYQFEYTHPLYEGHFIGIMAQDVEKKDPEAIWTHPDGWMMVNYDILESKYNKVQ